MLRKLVVAVAVAVLVAVVVVMWLAFGQPNKAFAQNPTQPIVQATGESSWKPGDPFAAPMPQSAPPGESFATPTNVPVDDSSAPLSSPTEQIREVFLLILLSMALALCAISAWFLALFLINRRWERLYETREERAKEKPRDRTS